MNVTIRPQKLCGTITPPPSKSQAHRLIIAAALADGESVLSNVAFSQDILATLSCMEQLGARWEKIDGSTIRVQGLAAGAPVLQKDGMPHFDCGESGSTLRFLIPIALAVAGGGVFSGRGRLMERPQKPYFDLFEEKGISWEQKDGTLTVRGTLESGTFLLPGNVSSQFFTGLLYALPLLDGASRITATTALESESYIAMTMDALKGCGVAVDVLEGKQGSFFVPGAQRYAPTQRRVEADWSQAGFWYAAMALGNLVDVTGMSENSRQGDQVVADAFVKLCRSGDVELDVADCPDLVPPLAAMAAVRKGTTSIVHAARLRIKESDRLSAVTAVMNALGAHIEELHDGLVICGLETLCGGVSVDACNDHRIAMMAAVAATRCKEPVTIEGAECVRKSYPNFWEDYEMLGGAITREG
ncbi:3-phosphoshikimate 1-carboxyvinyltransferase [bacterium 210917-DFI.7.65]|nr:3-phosphoshikimate 1-carboxyvinyltransferase [bacterium 210917-DFI.7.65]